MGTVARFPRCPASVCRPRPSCIARLAGDPDYATVDYENAPPGTSRWRPGDAGPGEDPEPEEVSEDDAAELYFKMWQNRS